MNHRWELIQAVIDKIGAQSYLEIGIADGVNLGHINCLTKTTIDPNQQATFKVTSDDYFQHHKRKYDVIFIDGNHEKEQVKRDINNSLECLSPNGVIITHDTLPLHESLLGESLCWNAWEAFAYVRYTNPNVFAASVILDGDNTGCGIIKHGSQVLYDGPEVSGWKNFLQDRDKRMNVMPVEQVLASVQ